MKEYTNQEWYEGLLQNDDDVVSGFYDKMTIQITSLCRRYNVDETNSEQIFIDAFALCLHYIKIGKYKFIGHNPSSYAYQIAYFTMQEHFRNAPPVTTMEAPEEPINEDWAKQFFKEEEKRQIFHKAFGKLGLSCQRLLTMRHIMKLKDQAIADLYKEKPADDTDETRTVEEAIDEFFNINKDSDSLLETFYNTYLQKSKTIGVNTPNYTARGAANLARRNCSNTLQDNLTNFGFF